MSIFLKYFFCLSFMLEAFIKCLAICYSLFLLNRSCKAHSELFVYLGRACQQVSLTEQWSGGHAALSLKDPQGTVSADFNVVLMTFLRKTLSSSLQAKKRKWDRVFTVHHGDFLLILLFFMQYLVHSLTCAGGSESIQSLSDLASPELY